MCAIYCETQRRRTRKINLQTYSEKRRQGYKVIRVNNLYKGSDFRGMNRTNIFETASILKMDVVLSIKNNTTRNEGLFWGQTKRINDRVKCCWNYHRSKFNKSFKIKMMEYICGWRMR